MGTQTLISKQHLLHSDLTTAASRQWLQNSYLHKASRRAVTSQNGFRFNLQHSDLTTAASRQWLQNSYLHKATKTAVTSQNGVRFNSQLSSDTTQWSAKHFTIFITVISFPMVCSCRSHDVHAAAITWWRRSQQRQTRPTSAAAYRGKHVKPLCRLWTGVPMLWWQNWIPQGCHQVLAICMKLEWDG